MRAAAGADVGVFNRHNPHASGQRLLAAVGNLFQLFFGREGNSDFAVFPDDFVRLALDLPQIVFRQHAGKIDRHHVGAHVKAHVVVAEAPVDNAGENMLAGVQLHQAQTPFPVDAALHLAARLQRLFAVMHNFAASLMRIRHADAGQTAGISRLTAALGVKCRPVQHHIKSVLSRRAGQDLCPEIFTIDIFIKELFSCHLPTACFA